MRDVMKIEFSLSQKSIQEAINQVENYRKSLQYKCELFTEALANIGRVTATTFTDMSPLGKTVRLTVDSTPERMGCKAVLVAVGKQITNDYGTVDTLLLIEFGAGIHFNHVPNPKADDFGLGVGTFPNQKNAWREEGWSYLDNEGNWHHSFGVKAMMPMYEASLVMRANIVAIAKKIFKS